MKLLKKIWWTPFAIYLIIAPSIISDKLLVEKYNKIKITIKDSLEYGFVNSSKIMSMVHSQSKPVIGKLVADINLQKIETKLKQIKELESVEVYNTIDGTLHINADQRNPVVRIISKNGSSFYLDNTGKIIPHSSSFTPRVLVVSGSISVPNLIINKGDINTLNKNNSLHKIIKLVNYINNNELWTSQFEQVWVRNNGNIELVPRVGNNIIKLGKPDKYVERLQNLEAFYLTAIEKVGWNKYSEINLMYEGQIVCKRRKNQ